VGQGTCHACRRYTFKGRTMIPIHVSIYIYIYIYIYIKVRGDVIPPVDILVRVVR
jgi:hypothetical protein